MSSKRRGSIRKQNSPENAIPKQHPLKEDNGFSFSPIYYNWIKGIDTFYKSNDFTNMVKDAEEFSANITEISTEIVPKLYNEHKSLFNNNGHNYHCHKVAEDKKELVKEIAEEIHATKFDNNQLREARIQWWYLGFKQNIRLVGLYDRSKEVFYPMFIDHHHLIHQNDFFNQPDFKKYDYCPITAYNDE